MTTGDGGNSPDIRETNSNNYEFGQIIQALNNKKISDQEKTDLEKSRDKMIFEALNEGYLDVALRTIPGIIKNSDWDSVYSNVLAQSENLEATSQGIHFENDQKNRWRGMVKILVEGSADQIVSLGLEKKARESKGTGLNLNAWETKHGYSDTIIDRLRQAAEIKRGDVLLPDGAEILVGENKKIREEINQPPQPVLTESAMARAVARGQEEVMAAREPSLDLAVLEYQRAERLLNEYKPEAFQLILNRIKGRTVEETHEQRTLMETAFKVFQAAYIKRQAGNMKGISENGALKGITETDMRFLFQNMMGYQEAMQEIADVIVNRKNIGALNFSLLDCQTENQFIEAAEEFDQIIKARLVALGIDSDDAEIAAPTAFNTALNTMYAFGVPEFYSTKWEGRRREKFKECANTAPVDPKSGKVKTGPTPYDRLVVKAISDSFHPMDDLIVEALKKVKDKSSKNNITEWAETQMANQGLFGGNGVKELTDFDEVVVLTSSEDDTSRYWTVARGENGRRVLQVPPVRPTRIFGSVLDQNKVNIGTQVKQVGGRLFGIGRRNIVTNEQKTFLQALLDKDQIDWSNSGLASNFCTKYTLVAGDLDVLKDTFRDKKELKDWPEISKAMDTFEQGDDKELLAWMYVDLADAINPKKRSPELLALALKTSKVPRMSLMKLPEHFNILQYLRSLKEDQRIKYK